MTNLLEIIDGFYDELSQLHYDIKNEDKIIMLENFNTCV
jgi:hypothetical protein